MSNLVGWIAAEAERPKVEADAGFPRRTRHLEEQEWTPRGPVEATAPNLSPAIEEPEPSTSFQQRKREEEDRERERRTYRGRTVAMLRRYMRYSIETGRLPSLLGREFFRAKVTSYTVVTFEDRVIFVHD